MPTSMSEKQSRYYSTTIGKKNYTQTVGIIVGSVMIILGLCGMLYEEFMGLHLSAMHSLMLTGTGALSIWSAVANVPKRAYQVNLGLGIWFAIHAIAGFTLGEPGMPRVGYEARDQLLLRIAPGFLELGTVDHALHLFLAIFFITGAISWKRHHTSASERRVE